jgi:hypothetical protein
LFSRKGAKGAKKNSIQEACRGDLGEETRSWPHAKRAKGAKKDRSKGFLGELGDRSTELTTKS